MEGNTFIASNINRGIVFVHTQDHEVSRYEVNMHTTSLRDKRDQCVFVLELMECIFVPKCELLLSSHFRRRKKNQLHFKRDISLEKDEGAKILARPKFESLYYWLKSCVLIALSSKC